MDAKKIQQFYLRALYTAIPDDARLGAEEQFVLKTMQLDRLEIERAARLRNLRSVLHDDMCLMNRLISKSALFSHVQAYAASPYFWLHRGRTLIEDFCLFFVEFGAADAVTKLVAEIEGVHSGMSALDSCHTPWQGHKIIHEAAEFLEFFPAPFALAWKALFNNSSGYTPIPQPINCYMRRTNSEIRVKFTKGEDSDAQNWLGPRLSA